MSTSDRVGATPVTEMGTPKMTGNSGSRTENGLVSRCRSSG